jgi:putative ATPase
MVESQDQIEILTYAVGERTHDRWLQRTVGNAGERLGRVRDRVLDAAQLQRHHVVLDLNAGTGLLTWEILRRTPEGGTWVLARDRQEGEGLRQQAEQLPEMQRPLVVVVDPSAPSGLGLEEVSELLALRGEGDLRFDAIVGRNALARVQDKVGAFRLLASWLRPGGRLSLVEMVVRRAQRLHELLDLSGLDGDLRQRVIEAEEQIYAESGDSLVNWEASDLKSALGAAGFEGIAVEERVQEFETAISAITLDHWFTTDMRGDRLSYAGHLLRRVTKEEIAQVRALFDRHLANQTVTWRNHLAFVVGHT